MKLKLPAAVLAALFLLSGCSAGNLPEYKTGIELHVDTGRCTVPPSDAENESIIACSAGFLDAALNVAEGYTAEGIREISFLNPEEWKHDAELREVTSKLHGADVTDILYTGDTEASVLAVCDLSYGDISNKADRYLMILRLDLVKSEGTEPPWIVRDTKRIRLVLKKGTVLERDSRTNEIRLYPPEKGEGDE